MTTCRPRFITLTQAAQQLPFLKRAVEQRLHYPFANPPPNDFPCWVFAGWLDHAGYGRVQWKGQSSARVHRVTFIELRNGGQDTHLVLDHLCRNRACCNPWHLQAVTPTVNTQRGARADGMCRNGLHRMEGANVIVRTRDGLPRYECRACKEARR